MSHRLVSTTHHRAAAAGLWLVAALLLTGCGSEVSDSAPPLPGTATAAPTSAASASPGTEPNSAPAPSAEPTSTTIDVTYAGGKVSGVDGRVSVPVGEPVVLRVTSDVAEEVHVHGYDVKANVPAGGTAEIPLTASIPGTFEVELESTGKLLFQLRVS